MKRTLQVILILVTVSAVACTGIDEPSTGAEKPNVLIILTDDQGFGDVHIHGNDSIDTPVMDGLALGGIRMNHFYVSPVCAPTRASLLTGRYHYRTGTTWMTRNGEAMRANEVTLAELFKANDYATGCFGKWHNGSHFPQNPLGQGFDVFSGFSGGHWNRYYDPDLEIGGEMVTAQGYITDIFTTATADFIIENKDRPFFAYLAYNTPHTPLIAPDSLFQKYRSRGLTVRNASIYGMTEAIDLNIGRLLKILEGNRLLENTLVVFMTDNGPNGNRYRAGLKGTKGSVSDGGVRVPCFWYWKGRLTAGKTIDELTAHIDVLPTLTDLLELETIPTLPLDGISFADLLRGKKDTLPDRTFYTFSTNQNKFKGSLRNSDYRLTINGKDQFSLTRLIEDPEEKNDLSSSMPEYAQGLYNEYLSKYEEVIEGLESFQPIPLGYPEAAQVTLPAHEGFFKGKVRYKSSLQGWANDWFVDWRSELDTMYWELAVAEPGKYRVAMKYSAKPENLGTSIFCQNNKGNIQRELDREFSGEVLKNREQMSRGRVADDQTWGELSIGELEFGAGRQRVLLYAENIQNDEVAEVKGLILRRIP